MYETDFCNYTSGQTLEIYFLVILEKKTCVMCGSPPLCTWAALKNLLGGWNHTVLIFSKLWSWNPSSVSSIIVHLWWSFLPGLLTDCFSVSLQDKQRNETQKKREHMRDLPLVFLFIAFIVSREPQLHIFTVMIPSKPNYFLKVWLPNILSILCRVSTDKFDEFDEFEGVQRILSIIGPTGRAEYKVKMQNIGRFNDHL